MAKKKSVFLKAHWSRLIMANYEVEAERLLPWLPAFTELDFWQGKTFLSLVGFEFQDTRILGIRIPFHINFTEINLRMYVRYREDGDWKRGVVFIREIVPKPAIAWVANTLYHEHYAAMPCRAQVTDQSGSLRVKYEWKHQHEWYHLQADAASNTEPMQEGSEEEFIAEHYWGYTRVNEKKTYEYAVEHPRWEIHPVSGYTIHCNFESLYGRDFAFLNLLKPSSVFLAAGSEVLVRGKKNIF